MLSKKNLFEYTGLDSWLDLYCHIQSMGLHGEIIVMVAAPKFIQPSIFDTDAPKKPAILEDWQVDMEELRSLCFLEVFPKLPTRKEIDEITNFFLPMAYDHSFKGVELKAFLTSLPIKQQ